METVWIGAIVILIFVFHFSAQKLRARGTGLQTSSEKKEPSTESVSRLQQDEDGNLSTLAVDYKKALESQKTLEATVVRLKDEFSREEQKWKDRNIDSARQIELLHVQRLEASSKSESEFRALEAELIELKSSYLKDKEALKAAWSEVAKLRQQLDTTEVTKAGMGETIKGLATQLDSTRAELEQSNFAAEYAKTSFIKEIERLEKGYNDALQHRDRLETELQTKQLEFRQYIRADRAAVDHPTVVNSSNGDRATRTNEADIAIILEQNEILKQRNSSLCTRLAELSSAPGQRREDAHYTQPLNMLNQMIQGWVARVFKGQCMLELSEESELYILAVLKDAGLRPHGTKTAELLSHGRFGTIQTIFQNSRRRMVLVRHIIALFLWGYVFDRFVFGLSARQRDFEQASLTDFKHEFRERSTTRQAIGRGILHLCKAEQARTKDEMVEKLETTLSRLLPKPSDIHLKLVEFVEKAVEISNDMSVEQCLFRCFMANQGEIAREDCVHIVDEEQYGPVFMCTFPGFEKEIEYGKRKPFLKAVAELESAFM